MNLGPKLGAFMAGWACAWLVWRRSSLKGAWLSAALARAAPGASGPAGEGLGLRGAPAPHWQLPSSSASTPGVGLASGRARVHPQGRRRAPWLRPRQWAESCRDGHGEAVEAPA